MKIEEIIKLDKANYLNTFGDRIPVAFERGEGVYLYTEEGESYLDFFAGIAVNALGHAHKNFTEALHEQLDKLLHTSSIYYVKNQALLAQRITQNSCADKVYFANSGAEANEAAVKLAKIYFYKQDKNKTDVITLRSSFHGRTMAMVAATGQEKYQKPYYPLTPGFSHVPINDIAALKAAITDKTCAILVEPIQGESGVHPLEMSYAKKLRELCDEKDIILIFDEVQTGMGRTGHLFAYQMLGVEPDIFTLAKALGGGIPIGAVCAKDFVAKGFEPGDHGGTFGGNPFATAAGLAVFDIIEKEHLCENAAIMGKYLAEKVKALSLPQIKQIRQFGLMIGIETEDGAAQLWQKSLFEHKVLVGSVAGKILRVLPPLIVERLQIDEFVEKLSETAK
ncbi:MAG: aspartate aminotransferase family protein [Clostridia bacterium]|nr:aspartate aminotransferase family protein [Clostridia bacterium]